MDAAIFSTASLLGPAAVTASKPNNSKPTRAADAAQQFEGLLLSEMMKSARESSASLEEEGESESSTMFDVADQQFAAMLAKSGGIGLSRLVAGGLKAAPDH